MATVERTDGFAEWESRLKGKDLNAAARVAVRIQRLALGNLDDGVSELRIPYRPGYRVYDITAGDLLILLLTGGVKPTQQADINEASAWRGPGGRRGHERQAVREDRTMGRGRPPRLP